MTDVAAPVNVQAPSGDPTAAASKPTTAGTHTIRICNKDPVSTGCGHVHERAENGRGKALASEDLPDGWVRHGTGLMLDVPITPRMRASSAGKVAPAHLNFAGNTDAPPVKQLQVSLVQIDREAVRRMRRDQSMKIKAPHPGSESQKSAQATRGCPARVGHMAPKRAEEPRRDVKALQDHRKLAAASRDHAREILHAKQQVLEHVDGLIKKYRQLAIDAVRVAREEQRKAEEERRNVYEACERYEADLKANVRNAINHLKVSAHADQERLTAERDALLRKCADLSPLRSEAYGPSLDHVTSDIAAQHKHNLKFSIGLLDDSRDKITEEFRAFKHEMASGMVQSFSERGCALRLEDASAFVEAALRAQFTPS